MMSPGGKASESTVSRREASTEAAAALLAAPAYSASRQSSLIAPAVRQSVFAGRVRRPVVSSTSRAPRLWEAKERLFAGASHLLQKVASRRPALIEVAPSNG